MKNEQIWSAINKQMEINEDIEKRFQNRLKLQRQIFEEMIEEQSTYFKLQLKTISEELKQAKDVISDLKGQLRQVQKDVNDNIKDPRHHSTKSVSAQTITNDKRNKKPTQLLTDNLINTQIVETKDDCVTDIPKSPVIAKSNNNIYTHLCDLPESLDFSKPLGPQNKEQTKSDALYSTVLKSSGSSAAKNYIEIKESHQQQQQQHRQTTHVTSTSPSNQTDKTGKQPILILGDSMIKGIKEHLLNRQTYIKKVCISGATVKDFIEVVKNMNDPTPYAKILIHLGTNDIRNDNESTIINNLKHLILLIQQRWETATIIFSGIILHRNDSRKNIKINSVNTTIKHELQDLNIEFLDNVNVVTLPSGHIDPDAYFDNLHLNNEKGTKKLANNFKIHLELKSRGERPRNRKFISTRETNLHHSLSGHPYIQTPFTFTGKKENEVFTQIPPISYYHVNQQSRNGYPQYRNNYNRIPNNHRPQFQPRLLESQHYEPQRLISSV